ncbi:MAG: 50S ribosomal protein L24 [Acidimicrobiia bacterium]
MKVHKGDRVQVIAGKDLGKQGQVMKVDRERARVLVEGVNTAKKHQRALKATMQAGIIDKDMPIHISNVALICRSCGPTRAGYRLSPDGKKSRICRKCKGDL